MESINSAIASAKSALGYGNETGGQEPISGEQGAGTITQPYDKGNETTATQITQDQPTTTTTSTFNSGLDYNPEKLSNTTLSYRPGQSESTSTTGVTPTLPSDLGTDNAPETSATAGTNSADFDTTHLGGSSSNTNASTTGVSSTTNASPSNNSSSTPAAMDGASSTPSQPGMKTADSDNQPTSSFDGSGTAPTNQPVGTGAPAGQSRPDAGERSGDVRPTEANENRPGDNAGGFGTVEPSVNADPKSAQQPKTEHEGADRPLNEPDSDEAAAINDDKEKAENAQEGKSTTGMTDEQRQEAAQKGELPHDPDDHSGEPMHMHGGSEEKKEHSEKSEEEKEKARKGSIGQEGGAPHGSAKGTGEEVVKASGFAAEGGDFDAANAGAGGEATRLMNEKGMRKEGGPTTSGGEAVSDDQVSESKHSKPSMMQKIKDKMNPGTGGGLD